MSPAATAAKVALVTGAGSGIGKACALALLAAGWHVTFVGRRADPLQQAIDSAPEDQHERAFAVPADISKPDSVEALFTTVQRHFGRLDLLFNNAGLSMSGVLLEDLSYRQWREGLDTNLGGAFLCTQQAFRLMKSQNPRGGRIINNGSISAHAPRPNSVVYSASKHGITGLTKTAALDGRKYDIAVGQIDIGNALTDMTHKMAGGVPQADGSMREEPTMNVKHVADAVVHMASLPLDANVLFMTVMATKMPFVGRG
jgi:NAD(P)-dependent dehydrogenase (short-subunit alcohol dehydrogenase family)